MIRRVLVTGGSGFIGRATCSALRSLGYEPASFDRSNGDDVLDEQRLGEAMQGQAAVVHLAGMLGTSELLDEPRAAIDVNMGGTLNVLEACRRVGAHFVGITMPDVWPSLYQATKIGAQRVAEAWHNAHGVPVTHVRAFNAYGPGQAYGAGHPQKIVPTFAVRAWRGEPLPVWGDGEQTVDLVHADDIGHLLALAVNRSLDPLDDTCGHGQTWDAGTGIETTVLGVANHVLRICAPTRSSIEHLPMRPGELPGTKLAATTFMPDAPRPPVHLWDERFVDAVRSYAAYTNAP